MSIVPLYLRISLNKMFSYAPAYIKQLEDQNELPAGKALIRPTAGFVVKCFLKTPDESKRKLFLNVVYSDEIDKPTSSDLNSWSVPFALGPLRMEADKGKVLAPTFDCCFHPLSLQYAHGSRPFCDLIVDISKDAIQKSFHASGDDTELVEGYTILKGVSYKSGSNPKTLMAAAKNDEGKADIKQVVKANVEKVFDDITVKAEVDTTATSSVIVPNYKIVERGNFEIANHTTMTSKPKLQRPEELIVHVDLDRIESVVDISLDVGIKSLAVKSTNETVPQYKLEIELPYHVNSKKGRAKFDKKQSKLIVTLPVIEA